MTVTLRPMTPEEFVPYEDADVHHFAENMVQVGFWSTDRALDKAKDLHARLLPEGIHTPDHLFFMIEENQPHDSIGVLCLFISLCYQVQSSNMRKLLRNAGPNDPPI
jgi:hypothetical protein